MGSRDYYKRGSWNAYCDRCGQKFKADELRKEWDGFMVCSRCWEPRNAQELIRAKVEKPPPWTRPPGPDQFSPYQQGQSPFVIGGYMCSDAMMG